MEGFWYELAMKDITQPRVCKCTTSNKTVRTDLQIIHDTFTLECFGQPYPSNLSFDLTTDTTPGVTIGTWNGIPLVRRVRFPNTVVDVGVNHRTGEYDWMIEFQCIPSAKRQWGGRETVRFYAMNFYSKEYRDMEERIQLMEQTARELGLGPFLDTGRALAIIDHSNCALGHWNCFSSAKNEIQDRHTYISFQPKLKVGFVSDPATTQNNNIFETKESKWWMVNLPVAFRQIKSILHLYPIAYKYHFFISWLVVLLCGVVGCRSTGSYMYVYI